jgi:hypothetical protein
MEAWSWLEREGMIAYQPGKGSSDWVFVTRRGQQMRTAADLKAYQRAALLPRQLLHPALAAKVVGPFIRGDYDTAVFQAFKEVEVAVRTKAQLAATDIGVPLMRKAFDAKTGPLRDPGAGRSRTRGDGTPLRRCCRVVQEPAQSPQRPHH